MFYVTMSDEFMSNWGKAKGRINKLVFACENVDDMNAVYENAKKRSEMKYVNICTRKPSYPSGRYLVQYKTKETSPNWYKPGYFN